MSRENTYNAIILKKQPFGEGDEIITVYTAEAGKLRVLAKSVKLSKSKLSSSLQSLFLVQLRVAGGNLPKVIGCQVENTFSDFRENLTAANVAFYVTELCLRFTPDEQPSRPLFDLLAEFLLFLNSTPTDLLGAGLTKFKIHFLESLGLAVQHEEGMSEESTVGFSNSQGGFIALGGIDSIPTNPKALSQFLKLKRTQFSELSALEEPIDVQDLQSLLSGFLNYQLEREIKSEQYLDL